MPLVVGRGITVEGNISITTGEYPPVGQAEFTLVGLNYWQVPANVTTCCVVCVGAGGGGGRDNQGTGGGGGGLVWVNDVTVTPGELVQINVGNAGIGQTGSGNGTPGGNSWFRGNTYIIATGGQGGKFATNFGALANANGGTYINNTAFVGGGGNGGVGQGNVLYSTEFSGGGGGGAAGYTGNGGNGSEPALSFTNNNTNGNGGGGGGGASWVSQGRSGGGGGGVGIKGQGSSGNRGSGVVAGFPAFGGSGGAPGGEGNTIPGPGGDYGGGGGGGTTNSPNYRAGNGGRGAVRVIWGLGRYFPNTNTGDLY